MYFSISGKLHCDFHQEFHFMCQHVEEHQDLNNIKSSRHEYGCLYLSVLINLHQMSPLVTSAEIFCCIVKIVVNGIVFLFFPLFIDRVYKSY